MLLSQHQQAFHLINDPIVIRAIFEMLTKTGCQPSIFPETLPKEIL
ncbi:MAG: hypothetical protein V7K67_33435 [Nostoc sp.]